jgi:hypothetical protein
MSSTLSNQQLIDHMTRQMRNAPAPSASSSSALAGEAAASGVTLDNFGVTFPNGELIVTAEVTGIPAGAMLLGVTVAAAPSSASSTTYAMGMAADNGGLELPVSVLGASTLPSFPAATGLVGVVVATYSAGGKIEDAVVTQSFVVGG